ncbi:MAG: aminoacyl--tRNA ligase-related protein [Halobacteria archaeon]
MEQRLKGSFALSRTAEAARATVERVLGDAAARFQAQAPPPGGVELLAWSLDGDRLDVELRGGGTPPVHHALLQVKNALAGTLGKAHKIGIREVSAPWAAFSEGLSREEIDRELARFEPGPKYCDYAKVDEPASRAILFRDLAESELAPGYIDRILKDRMPRGSGPPAAGEPARGVPYGHLLRASKPKAPLFSEEVAAAGAARGWVKRFPGRAQWVLLPPAARLLYVLKDLAVEKVLRPLGFQEAMFPKLISMEVMAKMPGYFEHLPEGMFYASSPPREPEKFKEFKEVAKLKKEIRRDILRSLLPEPEYVLAPAQCEPFYQLFSKERVRLEDLPVKMFDASGWTYRSEGGGVEGLVRTTEFWRMESVWLGTPEQVVETRDGIAEKAYELAEKTLDLEARLVVGAPFYAAPGAQDRVDISESRAIPTKDLEVWLPYRGDRERSEWLEIGAYTSARTKYVDAFHIKEAKDRDIWTGCGGFGLTRWMAGFLAQKGLDADRWPAEVKKRYGKAMPGLKMVTWP